MLYSFTFVKKKIYCLLLFINCIYFVKGLSIIRYLYTYILLDIINYMNVDKTLMLNLNISDKTTM